MEPRESFVEATGSNFKVGEAVKVIDSAHKDELVHVEHEWKSKHVVVCKFGNGYKVRKENNIMAVDLR